SDSFTFTPALVARAGAHLDLALRPAERQVVRVSAVGAVKGYAGDPDVWQEDVALIAADAAYDAVLGDRPIAAGARLSYYDVFQPESTFDRAFRTIDGAAALTLRPSRSDRVVALAGVRAFTFKPDAEFDFHGEHVGLT